MNQSLSPAELEQRFAEINAREPEELTAEEAAALAEAEAMDDGSSVSPAYTSSMDASLRDFFLTNSIIYDTI